MNWKLILVLASLGGMMGVASVLGLTTGLEMYLWIVIAATVAVIVARKVKRRQFLHGFWIGIIGGALSPLVQVVLWSAYIRNNPELAIEFEQVPDGFDPRVFLLAAAPLISALSGIVQGALAWTAGKVLGEK
jgi:hypothetical protein